MVDYLCVLVEGDGAKLRSERIIRYHVEMETNTGDIRRN
jgi:hypothetical protein